MLGATVGAFAAAAYYAHIASKQHKQMVIQNQIARKTQWLDDRAWLTVSINPTLTFQGPVAVEILLDNLGKTEAKKLDGFAAIKVVPKGETPDLTAKGWKTKLDVSVLVPKFHKTIGIKGYKGPFGPSPQDLMTNDVAPGLKSGRLYLVVYGTLNYLDAWKVPHWIKFCQSIPGPDPRAKSPCDDYDGTDENEPPQ